MFDGIDVRMKKELKTLSNASIEVKVIAPNDRKFSVFAGCSCLSTLSSFDDMWITNGEYEEVGVNIVHRKCF